MRCIASSLVAIVILCAASSASAAPNYPLKVSPDGRHFVDQDGLAVLLNGDTPWSLISNATREEVITYLDDCVQRGFNSLIVTSPDKVFTDNAPANAYGDAPFTTPGDFSTPNEAYFAHADWVIDQARIRGIQILLAPCYLGAGTDEGWYLDVRDNNSVQTMRTYGEWVGNRYKNTPNLMIHWGNDVFPPEFSAIETKVRAMAEGLRSVVGDKFVTTYHGSPEEGARYYWNLGAENWIDFVATYDYGSVWAGVRNDYQASPTVPVILFESRYENEGAGTPLLVRSQAYQSLLSGACGHCYGNHPIWHMGWSGKGGNWQAALDDTGRLDMRHVRELLESRTWWTLQPDFTNTVLTFGQGGGDNRAVAAITGDRATIIAYIPSQRQVTIDMSELSGTTAKVWWFNPMDGTALGGTTQPSSSGQPFTPPTNQDWVLVIDDEASALPPPGTGVIVQEPADPPDGGTGTGGTGSADGGVCVWKPSPDYPLCEGTYEYRPRFNCSASGDAEIPPAWSLLPLMMWALLERRRVRR